MSEMPLHVFCENLTSSTPSILSGWCIMEESQGQCGPMAATWPQTRHGKPCIEAEELHTVAVWRVLLARTPARSQRGGEAYR